MRTDGQTEDRQTDMTNLIIAFSKLAKAPNFNSRI